MATDIAARGIDVATVSHVINYDAPDTADAYTHRVGRTGRATRTGEALTLVTDEDASLVRALERILGKPLERRRVEGFDVRSATRNSHAPEERVDSRRGPTIRTGATSGRMKSLRARRQWA